MKSVCGWHSDDAVLDLQGALGGLASGTLGALDIPGLWTVQSKASGSGILHVGREGDFPLRGCPKYLRESSCPRSVASPLTVGETVKLVSQ